MPKDTTKEIWDMFSACIPEDVQAQIDKEIRGAVAKEAADLFSLQMLITLAGYAFAKESPEFMTRLLGRTQEEVVKLTRLRFADQDLSDESIVEDAASEALEKITRCIAHVHEAAHKELEAS
jgi:hypothetical protein